MQLKDITDFKEVIQSSNLNFLLGSGVSTPFLPLLGDIEKKINESKNDQERQPHYIEYFKNVMLPNLKILENPTISECSIDKTKLSYEQFFQMLSKVLLTRKSTILSKQVNLFTTNIDILMECILEGLRFEYNDGFSGRMIPTFSLANFKKSQFQRSSHYDNISEIPVYNIIKIHGSITWRIVEEEITYSHDLSYLKDIRTEESTFINSYKQIGVVNPGKDKHLETVLNIYYYELLRMYSNELERENSVLMVLGFSMNDDHIKEITLRAAKSNPTLRIFVFCSVKEEIQMIDRLLVNNHPNIHIVTPENDDFFTLELFTQSFFEKCL